MIRRPSAVILLTPLGQGLLGPAVSFVIQLETNITIGCILLTADNGEEVVSRSDVHCRVYAADFTVIGELRVRPQRPLILGGAGFKAGIIQPGDKTLVVTGIARARQPAGC